jgi:hypothetical protein
MTGLKCVAVSGSEKDKQRERDAPMTSFGVRGTAFLASGVLPGDLSQAYNHTISYTGLEHTIVKCC